MRKPVCTVGYLVAVTLALSGCGAAGTGIGVGPAPSPTPTDANLAGTWDGRWASSSGGGSGTFVATLSQSGSTLSGTVSVTPGPPCLADALGFAGSVRGNNFEFAEFGDFITIVDFSGIVNPPGTSGSGTYLFCAPSTTDRGTFSMTRR